MDREQYLWFIVMLHLCLVVANLQNLPWLSAFWGLAMLFWLHRAIMESM